MSLEDIPTMTKDETDNQGHTVLYKGPAGSGKTHNILSWPQPIAVAYFDTNTLTLRQAMDDGVDVNQGVCSFGLVTQSIELTWPSIGKALFVEMTAGRKPYAKSFPFFYSVSYPLIVFCCTFVYLA